MFKSLHRQHQEILLQLLRGQREARRLRQADVAVRLGRVQAIVSKVESGERRLDVIELRFWLGALDVDFVEFVGSLDRQLNQAAPVDSYLSRRGRRRGAFSETG